MATSFRDEIRRGSITANSFIKNGGTADEILLGSGQTLSYIDDIRGHFPALIQIGSSAANNVIDNLPSAIFQLGEIHDTIVVLPCGGGTLDFSAIVSGLVDRDFNISKNRFHIYLLYITGNVTLEGAMVNPFVDGSGSAVARPMLMKYCSYKLECYFVDSVNSKKYPYPISFADVTPFYRVDGMNLVDANKDFDYALGVQDMPK